MTVARSPKRAGSVCGDQTACHRTAEATTVMVCDGIGSGVKANLAARLAISRLRELLDRGFSLRNSFARVVETVDRYKRRGTTYAALTAAAVLPDGTVSVLGYEAPAVVRVDGRGRASVLEGSPVTIGRSLVTEAACRLAPGEGLLIVSDGVTQAGLGHRCPNGWPMQEVARFLQERVEAGMPLDELPGEVHRSALDLWGETHGDDVTAALVRVRPGRTVNLLTGPPKDRRNDARVIERFLDSPGEHVVCGGTTASIVARQVGRPVDVLHDSPDRLAPPASHIDGVDLVTEGAVTLNQVANLLDLPPEELPARGPVADLCRRLQSADRVRLLVGLAENPAGGDVSLRQLGVLQREKIVARLAETLRSQRKLVLVEYA